MELQAGFNAADVVVSFVGQTSESRANREQIRATGTTSRAGRRF